MARPTTRKPAEEVRPEVPRVVLPIAMEKTLREVQRGTDKYAQGRKNVELTMRNAGALFEQAFSGKLKGGRLA